MAHNNKEVLNALNQAVDKARRAKNEEDRLYIVSSIGQDMVDILAPLLQKIAQNSRMNKEEMVSTLKEIERTALPKVQIDAPNIPDINVPPMEFPKEELISAIEQAVRQIKFPANIIEAPKMPKNFKVEGISEVNDKLEKLLAKEFPQPFDEIRATLVDMKGKPYKAEGGSSGGPSGGIMKGMSGNGPVPFAVDDDGALNLTLTGFTDSVQSAMIDSSGVQYSGSNPLPVDISSFTSSVQSHMSDSSGVAYSGSNPVPVTESSPLTGFATSANQLADDHNVTVSGITASTKATIIDSSGVGYSGSNPVPVTMAGATYSIRGAVSTAYVNVTNGTETDLLGGTSSVYHDLVYVMGANHSDSAVTVDVREVQTGGIVLSLDVPAASTAGVAPAIPIPQSEAGSAWTVDLIDDTQDIDITGLFLNNA